MRSFRPMRASLLIVSSALFSSVHAHPRSLEFEHRNFPRHWSRRHSTFVIRKAGSNTSRKVLEKHVYVAENRRPQKTKSYASDTNNCFDDQSFSGIGVLFSTQRRRGLCSRFQSLPGYPDLDSLRNPPDRLARYCVREALAFSTA